MDWRSVGVWVASGASLVVILGVTELFWTFLVHEPAHALVCVLGGYDASIFLSGSGLQPNMECTNMVGATYGFVALKTLTPYLMDLIILAAFAYKIPKNKLKLIPYTAFADILIFNFLPHLLNMGENDYTKLNEEIRPAYLLSLLIILTTLIVSYVRYREDARESMSSLARWWRGYLGS